jgi:hypothetical protein
MNRLEARSSGFHRWFGLALAMQVDGSVSVEPL